MFYIPSVLLCANSNLSEALKRRDNIVYGGTKWNHRLQIA
jgi:hypothetical protein